MFPPKLPLPPQPPNIPNKSKMITAKKFADYFGVPIETFTEEEPPETVEIVRDELFEKRKILFDLSEKATKEDLDKFIKMMNVMLGED